MKRLDNCTIGGRIREQRRKKGWSQDNLATELDTSKALISQYENGIITVPAKRIEQIAQLLDTSSGYLLSGEISRENKDKRLNQINLWYESLEDDSDRQFVFEQVELAIRWISKKEKECKW